jgi:hypothetical protein
MSAIPLDIEKARSRETLSEDQSTIEVPAEPQMELKDGLQPTAASEPKQNPELQDPDEYISGFKLILATGVVALASFTMLLDTSIVVTVSPYSLNSCDID